MEQDVESKPSPDQVGDSGSVAPQSGNSTSETPRARFAFIDGIRGLSALGVAAFHIWRYEPEPQPAREFVPEIVAEMLQRVWFVLQMLLVISGFVIAYTLRDTRITPREAWSFVVRRMMRLVPAYWVTLFSVMLLAVVCNARNFPPPYENPLTGKRVLTHLTFLQDIFEQTPLSAGIWTLCIEMQFYVVFVLFWGIAQRLRRGSTPHAEPATRAAQPSVTALLLLFGPLAAVSLFIWNRQVSTEPWITHFLGTFFLGLMAWWALDRTVPLWTFVLTVAVVVVGLTVAVVTQWSIEWQIKTSVALATTLALYAAGRTGHLHDWLNYRWLQYCGRISYSLYLIHYPVSHFVTSWGWRACGDEPTPVQSTAILAAAFALSLIAAHWLYTLVEAPSNRLAARWKTN